MEFPTRTMFCFCVVFLPFLISRLSGEKISVFPNTKTEVSEEIAYEKLLKLESSMKMGIESLLKSAIPILVRQSSEIDLSESCMASLLKTMLALRDMKLWAFQMLDAMGKPPSGMLLGTPGLLGQYHQCLSLVIPDEYRDKNSKRPLQTGQYCIVTLRTPIPPRAKRLRWFRDIFQNINATMKTEVMNEFMKASWSQYDTPMKLGLCVPSACTEDDLRQLLQVGASKIGITSELESCELPGQTNISTLQITIISIFFSTIVLCCAATLVLEVHKYRCKKSKKERANMKILESLSIVENFQKLMKTKPAQKRSLDAMNGIRFLSATWVLLGHSFIVLNRNQLSHLLDIKDIYEDFFLSVITGSFMSVDSFLFITGTLVAYNIVATYDSKKSFQPVLAILRRIWRFFPTILFAIGFGFLYPLLSSGPEYKSLSEDLSEQCYKTWWYHLLFIGNFKPVNESCMGHLWYLSADLQLFLFAMIYFLLLFRKAKYGMLFLGISIFAADISTGVVTYMFEFPPAALFDGANLTKVTTYFSYVTTLPYVHVANYSIGLFLGTFIARNKDTSISKVYALIGWIVAIGLGLTAVYGVYPWVISYRYTMVEAIMYSSFQRTIWGLALAWLVYACYVGKAGYINDFLSWPGFQPLVKLSFQLYVIHLVVQFIYWFSRTTSLETSRTTIVYSFFANLCISHIASLTTRLFIEAPGIELERVFCAWLFRGSLKKDKHISEHQLEEKYTAHNATNENIGEENGGFKL